ncbi:hypothetical protein EST38_g2486 [Candolleomyces aberdarensis]|uniref:TECPR1-like DysF domain-containing protein n=1 Tax=Candolleomyces aberdarensis TaxID=2316362 RepID=A0A4Q2DSW3_9AGAR|nr:hypothetical protein EST38_g2486 [Candolleomyces aberdarensis]
MRFRSSHGVQPPSLTDFWSWPRAFAYIFYRSRVPTKKQNTRLVTEQILANTVSDLSVITALLPAAPQLPAVPLRALAALYIPYLLITSFIPLRVLLAVTGTVIFTWRAPFAVILRTALWRSAFLRWSVYTAWAHISGRPLPPKSVPPQPTISTSDSGSSETATTTESLRFLFTIHENQRWWMGLDWTHALLPGERPSWCSPVQAPLSPPGAFTLPEPTTVYLQHPTDKTKRVKRTGEWYWEEPEWTVLVRREGTGVLSRVERPVPVGSEEKEGATGSRLFRAASVKFAGSHTRDDSSSSHSISSERDTEVDTGATSGSANEPFTDQDGWVYGDNKWENQSSKGGISKYTRFRRWTRVAVLAEFVQVVDADSQSASPTIATKPADPKRKSSSPSPISVSISKDGSLAPSKPTTGADPVSTTANATTAPTKSDHDDSTQTVNVQPQASPALMSPTYAASPTTEISSPPQSAGRSDSPLRQRLRMALNK